MTSSLNWCFTYNNPTLEPPALFDPTRMSYFICQHEVCPTTGTPHLQGYLRLTKKARMSFLKKIIPEAHWEIRKKSHETARKYCMKTGEGGRVEGTELFEAGDPPSGGKRTDLEAFKESVKQDMSFAELTEAHSDVVCKYPGFANTYFKQNAREKVLASNKYALPYLENWQQKLRQAFQLPPTPRKIHWVWSDSSETGKTATLKSLQHEFSIMPCTSFKYADILHAYKGEKVIWFNIPRKVELNATHWAVLEYLSDDMIHLSTKYDSMQVVVNAHIVVTTNHHPKLTEEALPKRLVKYHARLGDNHDSAGTFAEEYGAWPSTSAGALEN